MIKCDGKTYRLVDESPLSTKTTELSVPLWIVCEVCGKKLSQHEAFKWDFTVEEAK